MTTNTTKQEILNAPVRNQSQYLCQDLWFNGSVWLPLKYVPIILSCQNFIRLQCKYVSLKVCLSLASCYFLMW